MANKLVKRCSASLIAALCRAQSLSRVRLFVTPWTVAPRLLCPWGSPGKNTGVGCHFLLQGILPTQGSNPPLLRLLRRQVNSFTTEPLGKPQSLH